MVKELTIELVKAMRRGEYVSCKFIHDGSCFMDAFRRGIAMMKYTAILYGPAHFLPMLIFRTKEVIKNPKEKLGHATYNTVRSCLFGSIFIAMTKLVACYTNWGFKSFTRKNWLICGPLPCVAVFIEAQSRVTELTLYLLPRLIETVWNLLKKYKIVVSVKYGEVAVMGIAMSLLMGFLHTDPRHIKHTYQSTLQIIFGKN